MEPKEMCNLTLHLNGKVTKLVSHTKLNDPVSGLSEFQLLGNAELTKLIQSQGEPPEEVSCENEEESDDDTSAVIATPKKRKT